MGMTSPPYFSRGMVQILVVVEDLRHGHVVLRVLPHLDLEQALRVAQMGQQAFRHDLEIAKQCGESSPIQADDGIPRVDHIERNVAIEGIDHHLDGIADVAHAVFRRFGIRVAAGDGVGVLDPEQATPLTTT